MSVNKELSQVPPANSYEEPVPAHYEQGYHRLPQDGPLPPPYTVVLSSYAPAPQSFVSQQSPQLSASTTVPQEQGCEPSTVTDVVLTEVDKHPPPATEPQLTPPSYPGNITVPQHDVTSTDPHAQQPPPVTTQPRRVETAKETSGPIPFTDGIFFLSIFLCVICCLCGSPVTVACFIPAIFVSAKIKDYNQYGDYVQARNASVFALVLDLVGFLSGAIVLALFIIFRIGN